MSENNISAKFQIGSKLFYGVWISSICLLSISIVYLAFCPYSFKIIYPIYVLLLIVIGLLLLPFGGKFNVGKIFSIELKQLNSSIEKLRDTIVNFSIKNTQNLTVSNVNGPTGEILQVYTAEESKRNLKLAYSLFQQRRIIESIEYFHAALKYDSDNWVAAMFLGFTYLSLPDFQPNINEWGFDDNERLSRSIFYSTLAIRNDVNHYNQFMNLAIAQKHLGGERLCRLAIKNMEKAYNMLNFDQTVQNIPQLFLNKAKARSFMGEFEEAMGNRDHAIQFRQEALQLFNQCPTPIPNDLEIWKNQAQEALDRLNTQ